MRNKRLFKIEKSGMVSFAKPFGSKIKELMAKGSVLTYEQLNLDQQKQADKLVSSCEAMLSDINDLRLIAKEIKSQKQ